MNVDTALWVVVVIVLTCYIVSLKRRIRAIDHPMLAMSRRQRRKWAHDELANRQFEKNLGIVQGRHEGEHQK